MCKIDNNVQFLCIYQLEMWKHTIDYNEKDYFALYQKKTNKKTTKKPQNFSISVYKWETGAECLADIYHHALYWWHGREKIPKPNDLFCTLMTHLMFYWTQWRTSKSSSWYCVIEMNNKELACGWSLAHQIKHTVCEPEGPSPLSLSVYVSVHSLVSHSSISWDVSGSWPSPCMLLQKAWSHLARE